MKEKTKEPGVIKKIGFVLFGAFCWTVAILCLPYLLLENWWTNRPRK